MTERQCWAYGPNGRCHHPAGHPGDHIIEITWTDDQCIQPGQPAKAVTGISVAVQEHVQETVYEESEPCVACGHMHRSAGCNCGCYKHV